MKVFLRNWIITSLAILAPLPAQQGHPLVGSWHGTWGPNEKDRTDVTVIFNWDGKSITGLLNPGLDPMKLENATLDPSNWTIHFETEGKDASGHTVHIVADGKIQNITSVRRSIVGTWIQGSIRDDFKITRDN
jgi:hypothetical protein